MSRTLCGIDFPAVLALLEDGTLSAGLAVRLSRRPILRVAKIVVQKNLSVRETERLVQQPDRNAAAKSERKIVAKTPITLRLKRAVRRFGDEVGSKTRARAGAR